MPLRRSRSAAAIPLTKVSAPSALEGWIDTATRQTIAGWAFDPSHPASPVSLLITAGDELLGRVLADLPRADLADAGIGDGRHGFALHLRGLSPLEPHPIRVFRESDGAPVPGSPVVLLRAASFDAATQAALADLLGDCHGDAAELDGRLRFLAEQSEALLRLRALGRTRPPVPFRRALVIDERAPDPARDAGSSAILSHMQALQALGFAVTFAPADMQPDAAGVLRASGIAACHAPWHGAVEEVLRREPDGFGLICFHRLAIVARYLPLVRRYQPKARLICCVGELQHLLLSRQAELEERPDLAALAGQVRLAELRAAASVDVVVTHSRHEAALLRHALPGLPVHVAAWTVPPADPGVPFAARGGLAFIAHFGHPANADAAQWLTGTIMPGLRAADPVLRCVLAGSAMPAALRQGGDGIEVAAAGTDPADVLRRVRLTVAPMAFGAGLQGKVVHSLAAGVPCVCTPVAAEGLDLPPPLDGLVAAEAPGLAASILRLHADEDLHRACRDAGLAWVAAHCSPERIIAVMREAAGAAAR